MLPSHISETEILNTDLRKTEDREKWKNRPKYDLNFVEKEKKRLKKKYYRERKKIEQGKKVNPSRVQVMKQTGRYFGEKNNPSPVKSETEPETVEFEGINETKQPSKEDGGRFAFFEAVDEIERITEKETVYSVNVYYNDVFVSENQEQPNESYTPVEYLERKKDIKQRLIDTIESERPDIRSPGGAPIVAVEYYSNGIIITYIDSEGE
jgi:hypothetical protein